MCCKPPNQLATSLITVSRLRGCSRACEKIVLQPSPSSGSLPGAEQICDIVRMMFECKTLSDMAELLDRIRNSPDIKVMRFKDRMVNPSGGWRDAMINFCVKVSAHPNHICEVQIVHRKMYVCRRNDGLGGHDYYVQARNASEIIEFLGKPPVVRKPSSKYAFSYAGDESRALESAKLRGMRAALAAARIAKAWRRWAKQRALASRPSKICNL